MNRFLQQAKKFPVIDIGEYILREQDENDIDAFFEYFSDPIVNKYILCQPVKNREEARQELYYWRNVFYNKQGIYFAIADKKNNKMIGSIGFNNFNITNQRIELSYDLATKYWRKGIMTKSINSVINYIFKNWSINRVEAFTSTNNEPSIKLLQKCNFTFEGKLREHRINQGKPVDVFIFSFLRKDLILIQ